LVVVVVVVVVGVVVVVPKVRSPTRRSEKEYMANRWELRSVADAKEDVDMLPDTSKQAEEQKSSPDTSKQAEEQKSSHAQGEALSTQQLPKPEGSKPPRPEDTKLPKPEVEPKPPKPESPNVNAWKKMGKLKTQIDQSLLAGQSVIRACDSDQKWKKLSEMPEYANAVRQLAIITDIQLQSDFWQKCGMSRSCAELRKSTDDCTAVRELAAKGEELASASKSLLSSAQILKRMKAARSKDE